MTPHSGQEGNSGRLRAAKAIEFYKQAFGATETLCMKQPDGRVGHVEIRVGDSTVMMADENPEIQAFTPGHYGGSPVTLLLYAEDCDGIYQRAIAVGATCVREPEGQFYGDRMVGVKDSFGYAWFIATHIKDVSKEDLEKPH